MVTLSSFLTGLGKKRVLISSMSSHYFKYQCNATPLIRKKVYPFRKINLPFEIMMQFLYTVHDSLFYDHLKSFQLGGAIKLWEERVTHSLN